MKLAAVGDNCIDSYDNIGQAYPGGNPVNVAVYFVRMGGEASYTGAVGNDAYGQLMIDSLRAKGVDVSHLKVLEGSTAVTHVSLIDGERVLGDYDEGVLSLFKLSEEDIDFLCSHDMVVSGLWGMVEDELWKIRERGVAVAFDGATRPEDPACQKALPDVDYFFFSTDEGDSPELREKMRELSSQGPKIVLATLGEKGSLAYDGEDYTAGGIVPCEVVDTMGAGDSYIAGFLKGILEKKSLAECMRMGAENSSITLGYNGAW